MKPKNPTRWLAGATLVVAFSLLVTGCVYGGTTVTQGASGVVLTEGERCAVTLPVGWTWRPAVWTAVSPLGTQMGFREQMLGRPNNPNWEEVTRAAKDEANGAAIQELDNGATVRIDYGPNGGLYYLHRFDNVSCQLTFSFKDGARTQEQPEWDAIIASLERRVPNSPNA